MMELISEIILYPFMLICILIHLGIKQIILDTLHSTDHTNISFSGASRGHILSFYTTLTSIEGHQVKELIFAFVALPLTADPKSTYELMDGELKNMHLSGANFYTPTLFTTQKGSFLNVTVTQIHSMGYNLPKCLFRGLLVFTEIEPQLLKADYSKTRSWCSNKGSALRHRLFCKYMMIVHVGLSRRSSTIEALLISNPFTINLVMSYM